MCTTSYPQTSWNNPISPRHILVLCDVDQRDEALPGNNKRGEMVKTPIKWRETTHDANDAMRHVPPHHKRSYVFTCDVD